MKKVAIIIPARLKSARLLEKMLIKIGRYSLIQHTYLNALKSKIANKVIIATDSAKIQKEVQNLNDEVILTSSYCATGTDKIAEAINYLDENYNIIINIQGDEPQMHPRTIDKVGQILIDSPEVMISTAKTDTTQDKVRDINKVKVVCDKHNNALYFSRSPMPYPRNKEYTERYKHLGIYGYRREFFKQFTQLDQTQLELSESLEQLRALENGYKIKVIYSCYDSISVDTHQDLSRVMVNHIITINSQIKHA